MKKSDPPLHHLFNHDNAKTENKWDSWCNFWAPLDIHDIWNSSHSHLSLTVGLATRWQFFVKAKNCYFQSYLHWMTPIENHSNWSGDHMMSCWQPDVETYFFSVELQICHVSRIRHHFKWVHRGFFKICRRGCYRLLILKWSCIYHE